MLLCSTLWAQSEADAILTSRNILTGTARSMSLSNAMGAIGGDMTALTTNPAGIAVYRSSEFVFSQGLNFNNSTTNYYEQTRDDNYSSFPLQSIGYVGTYKPMREVKQGVVSTHFAFTYNRINSFNQNFTMEGYNVMSSMLNQFVVDASGYTPEEIEVPGHPAYFTSNLAYGAYLLEIISDEEDTEYFNTYESYSYDENNNRVYDWRAYDGIDQWQTIDSRGYTGEYSISGGVNISNKLLLGGSLNFQNLRYETSSRYREYHLGLDDTNHPTYPNADIDYFYFNSYRALSGNSVNVKLGFIYKPIHQLRIGFSYHSPNAYNMRQTNRTSIEAFFVDNEVKYLNSGYVDYDYRFQSPSKLISSLGFLLGNVGFLSIDYEYQNIPNSKFKSNNRDYGSEAGFQSMNSVFKSDYQATHSLRSGIEIKPTQGFMIRAGGGWYSSPIKSDYQVNTMQTYTASGGFGYRTNMFFLDLAYMAMISTQDYYPYIDDSERYYFLEIHKPAKLSSTDHRIALTLGWKF